MTVERRQTGFRYGKYALTVLTTVGSVDHNGRRYRVVQVRTHLGERYIALRLYNATGHFIKQMLMEPEIAPVIGSLLKGEG